MDLQQVSRFEAPTFHPPIGFQQITELGNKIILFLVHRRKIALANFKKVNDGGRINRKSVKRNAAKPHSKYIRLQAFQHECDFTRVSGMLQSF